MNYLAACDHFHLDLPGGGFKVAWDLARLMRDQGHHVSLLCGARDSDPRPGAVDVEGVRVVRYRFPRTSSLDPRHMSQRIRAATEAARAYLADRRWDAVHSFTVGTGLAAFRLFGDRSRTLATILSPTVLEQQVKWADGSFSGRVKRLLGSPLLKLYEAELLRRATGIHAMSLYTVAEVSAMYGEELGRRIVCIPWWAETGPDPLPKDEARRRLGWDTALPALFTLRRMVNRMGIDVFLDALAKLGPDVPRYQAFLGGDGPDRAAFEARAAANGLSGRVRFLGRLTDDEVAWAYAAADLFVLPTSSLECFGIITLEAFARGCPVVATNVGAIPEVVGPIQPQGLCPPGDARALARHLEAFLRGTLPLPSARTLKEYAEERYGRARVAGRYLAFLEGRDAPPAAVPGDGRS